MQTMSPIKPKWFDSHNNSLIFQQHSLMNIPMQFSFDAIKIELILCKLWLWVQMEHHMAMVHSCLMSTLMTIILMDHQKLIWLPQDMERSDSILTYMLAEKYVLVYLEHGEEVLAKIGIQRCQLYCKFYFQYKQSLWVKKYISMSQASKASKELHKVRRKTKLILILWDTVT